MRGLLVAAALCVASVSASAALEGRDLDLTVPGFEGVYDTVRNITWLADPYASGLVNWYDANAFIDNLNIGGHTGWRKAGGETIGLWNDWHEATLAEFGLDGYENGFRGIGADAGLNSHLFPGVTPLFGSFWGNAEYTGDLVGVWSFGKHWTDEGPCRKELVCGYAWAIRDGSVGAVPEPSTYALLLAGLLAVGARHHLLHRAHRRRSGRAS